MRHRFLIGRRAVVLVILFLVLAVALDAQAPSAASNQKGKADSWTAPRAAGGHPDLEGFWTNATLTPFERPAEFAGKEFFTESEAGDFEKRSLETANRDQRGGTAEADVARAYNEAWFERGTKISPTRRTSIVIDPPNGRIPPLTPQAQRAAAARAEVQQRIPTGPEDMSLPVRCILWPTAGPPMVPGPYNNNYQIVQTAEYVAIYVEMIHDVRIIPLDGRPHPGGNVRHWMGDSSGHWEGDTLVVDTTNFTDKTHYRGSDRNLHLVERFTRTGPDTILYRFTVDDPTAFTKPWTGEIPMIKIEGPLYEYACHEGNYAMANMLSEARAAEKARQSK
ncbi:MAG TPA: hypothetical protein VGZ73_11330 [Bryobacteraceae bacterium]|nr:hypothetical protein [Bryobacteraceae bacterium]